MKKHRFPHLIWWLGKWTVVYDVYLLACYDKANEEYQCKLFVKSSHRFISSLAHKIEDFMSQLGTSFTDEILLSLDQWLKERRIPKSLFYYRYWSLLTGHVWFDAVKVWERKCAEIRKNNQRRCVMIIFLTKVSPKNQFNNQICCSFNWNQKQLSTILSDKLFQDPLLFYCSNI